MRIIQNRPHHVGTARPKAQLSCNACRAKKIKCDRGYPCANCKTRLPNTCTYPTQDVPSKSNKADVERIAKRSKRSGLEGHVERLERIVDILAASKGPVSGTNGRVIDQDPDDLRDSPPQLQKSGEEARFVSSSHWEAILDDITDIKEELRIRRDEDRDQRSAAQRRPHLLFLSATDVSMFELLSSFPSQSSTEALIHLFMEEVDNPALPTLIHYPTLKKELKEFYENPKSVSLAWLALLYALLTLGLHTSMKVGKPVDGFFLPEESSYTYTLRVAQCLIMSDYTKPTKYTIEAMLLYIACEHFWFDNDHSKIYLIFNMVLRISLHAGYHRDPCHYPDMAILESEMRRRVWAFILNKDHLIAEKCGLPRGIDERQNDTLPPLNLRDQDLCDQHRDGAPPVALAQPTNSGFMGYKTQLLSIATRITDRVNSPRELSYEEVLVLNDQLDAQINARPLWLGPPTRNTWYSTGVTIPQLRHTMENDLITQRARMMLHRKYLIPARRLAKYKRSRRICLDAACSVLSHLNELSKSLSAKDLRDQSQFLSVMSHHFLLAAVLIGIDIKQDHRSRAGREDVALDLDEPIDTEQKLRLLEQSYCTWGILQSQSRTAEKAALTLEVMLDKLRPRSQEQQWTAVSPPSSNRTESMPSQTFDFSDAASAEPQATGSQQSLATFYHDDIEDNALVLDGSTAHIGFSENLIDIQDILDHVDMDIDWAELDARYFNPGFNELS